MSVSLRSQRRVTRDNGQLRVNGEPLGFYHYTGFDSGAHRIMAAKNAGNNQAVHQLVNWYANETASLAQDPLAQEPWAYGTYTDGTAISKPQRLVYRERTDLQAAFPDPFDATTYLAWWNSQGKVEFPDFFSDETRDLAMAKLSSVLTPGFRGGSDAVDWGKLGGILRQSLSQPKSGLEIGKRGWEILKNEGVSGLKRRLLA